MGGLTVACGLLAHWLYPRSRSGVVLCVAITVTAMFGYMYYAAGQLLLARLVPNSAAIVWTNLTPLFAALAVGWVLHLPSVPRSRKIALSGGLAVAAGLALFWPNLAILLRPPPRGGHDMQGDIVMQTAWATCSPAAAATLLHHEGIEASEAEMIPLCLTDNSGTPSLGLYRGLKLKASQHGRAVHVYYSNLNELLERQPWPMILTVKLPEYGVQDPRYEDEWGWIPGVGHTVVAFGQTSSGGLRIADPSAGVETWTRDDLALLWRGEGLLLTPPAPTR